ncbi:hypothetical protein [Amaricoccus sp. W119]|uniref:hypothetical protein n=1 Tax=Amaricoccus sp. W119 TaxID=3391833 RepID=UPI0039A6C0C7
MANERGFQSIRRPSRDEDQLLEALAERRGIARLQGPVAPSRAALDGAGEQAPPSPPKAVSEPAEVSANATDDAFPAPTPRARMKAMSLELPDYVMRELKRRALRDDCSVRYVIMRSLVAQGVSIHEADLVADGRRSRGK